MWQDRIPGLNMNNIAHAVSNFGFELFFYKFNILKDVLGVSIVHAIYNILTDNIK